MVYLKDEYYKEYPSRISLIRPWFDKFSKTEKYLHEMSLKEINSEVATWECYAERTIDVRRSALKLYYDWLEKQGIKVDITIPNKIVFPEIANKFLIYSTNEIHELWEELIFLVEQDATKGKPMSTQSLLVCYVANILLFYGLTRQEIMKLQLSDVQNDGIIGYDIAFTEKDMEILLRYKKCQKLGNGKPMVGTTYIRSHNENVDSKILGKALGKLSGGSRIKELKKILGCSNIYKLGIYNQIFQYELTHRPKVELNVVTPDWFNGYVKKIDEETTVDRTEVTIIKRKKEYVAYRTERETYINILTNQTRGLTTKAIDRITSKIDYIIESDIGITEIKNELRRIRNQISNLVK